MIKKCISSCIILLVLTCSIASADIYVNINSDISSRYVFRGFTPGGKHPAAALNFSAYFTSSNINVSQWFINTLGDISAYHESGTMINYYHYFNDRIIVSGGLTAYLYPGVPNTNLLGLEFGLTLSDIGFIIPYFVESYIDIIAGSWYVKLTGGYTFNTFLPINFTVSNGINLLPYTRYGEIIPGGFSDISAQLSTYVILKNWQFTPKLSYIIPLNTLINDTMMLQVCFNVGYSF
ncbi:MAG: hypothetical protein KAT14_00870 [Candidatus Marinimicrobia bacterium]|nr:hypothetical protein [Candidatus Neomarinimicrobiota bacterium]